MNGRVYVVATMDTKGAECAFVAERLRAAGVDAATVDVGTLGEPQAPPDVPRADVRRTAAAGDLGELPRDRASAVSAMSAALLRFLVAEQAAGRVAGVLGLGGGGGTSLICPAMQALPIGLPKLMVSTMASGNTAPYVGTSDLFMLYSVVDVAGLNSVSRKVLTNAAAAMAGMVGGTSVSAFGLATNSHAAGPARASDAESRAPSIGEKPAVALTMFGVTTPCVDGVRKQLEARGFDVLVSPATGSGHRAREKLVASGLVQGVIDVTTTAMADEVVGGVLPCGPERFGAILAAGISYVARLGALDRVNFGARATLPPQLAGRRLHVHNAQVTLMRTTADECRRIARRLAAKWNRSTAPLTVLVPERGLSAIDAPGQPFYDPEANGALFDELEATLITSPMRRLLRLPLHVNDPEFGAALTAEFVRFAASLATRDC